MRIPTSLCAVRRLFMVNVKEATALHQKLMPVFSGMFVCSNPIPVKESMNLLGYDVGGFRLPMVHASEKDMETIKPVLRNYGVLK